ncbi:ABC transporter ATP-binding protein [Planotetraspora thailandica]|uniref:ABC transporter ATP-binding protein n=1 Tax=Planotetraspora thailandica TaxID=487172 RepID=A0A8J3UYB9_9ACTN|nr:ABC transporter ATP-binding protein [Planotetraspora thailandica]GII51721.1 ABC transporter ATP-binding protein [Planotetraspora thailandica]
MRGAAGGLLRRALLREPRVIVRLAAWSVAEVVPAFAAGHAVARAIDEGFAAGRPVTGLAWLGVLAAGWLVAAVAARQILLGIAAVVEPFRDDLLTHVVSRAVSGLGAGPVVDSGAGSGVLGGGDTSAVARMNHQVELARDALAAIITVVRSFVFTLAGVALGMATLAPAVLPLVLTPVLLGLVSFLASLPALARRQRGFIVADEHVSASVAAMAEGLRDVVACGAEPRVAAAVGRDVAAQARAARALARVTAARTLALALGGWLPILLLLGATPWLLGRGVTAGVVLGSLTYVMQSLTPALAGLVQGLGVSGVRLAVTLDRILGGAVPYEVAGPRRPPEGAGLELRGVAFAYGPAAEPVIDGLDLVVPEGEHLAVVGPSGIGKSTLAGLVAGVLRPSEGAVTIGGVPAAEAEERSRALIPQEAYVFRAVLVDNLTYLAPDATEAEVDEAVAVFGLAGVAERYGSHTVIDPAELSAGERQLIALARTYLSPARLVVLDEATCHLDPAAEARAEAAFAARGGTLIVVAHRISSAARARRVLVMDGSRVRLGTHEELTAASPLYADLVGHWAGRQPLSAGPVAQDADLPRRPQPA